MMNIIPKQLNMWVPHQEEPSNVNQARTETSGEKRCDKNSIQRTLIRKHSGSKNPQQWQGKYTIIDLQLQI